MADDQTKELRVLTSQLEELNRIGAALSAERDTGRLLDLILTKARQITHSDAGSIYVVETAPVPDQPNQTLPAADHEPIRRLRFMIAQNDSVTLPFREGVLDITGHSIAGYVALTRETVMLDDAYVLPKGVPYTFNRSFDEAANYRTRSVLAVPMQTQQGSVVGVLQLLNATQDGAVVPYSERARALVVSLASQAAVALENSNLYREIRELFEGFVRASVVAIEARDPATSGHSFRVANLTVALAEAAGRADGGPFADVRFSREDMRTIRYASLLHDFGKVGVREEVLVKAKKLHPSQIDRVRERFRLARRTLEWKAAHARLDYVVAHGLDAYRERLETLEAGWRTISRASTGIWRKSNERMSRTSCRMARSSACARLRPSRFRKWTARCGRCSATKKSAGCRCAKARCRNGSASRSNRTSCTRIGSSGRFPGRERSVIFRQSHSATMKS